VEIVLDIINLKERPDVCQQLAHWHYQEWHALYPQDSAESFLQDLKKSLGDRDIPSTWIMVEGDQLLGSCSLIEDDMDSRQELTPWLANVFIHPQHRGRGLGSQLVRAVMDKARQAGVSRCYLFTEDQSALYRKLGWTVYEETDNHGIPVTLMQMEFSA
tara:strand:+ start:37273 stop:37749 length:477 start_codon:yes stop_codon:yes gene_type:complete